MAPKLIAEEGTLKGAVLSLEDGEKWVIGRDPDVCQIVVEDPTVSRKHVAADMTPEGIILENLSTTNPTLINEKEMGGPYLLQNGDGVRIGSSLFRYYSANAEMNAEDLFDDENSLIEEEQPSLLEDELPKDEEVEVKPAEELAQEPAENVELEREDLVPDEQADGVDLSEAEADAIASESIDAEYETLFEEESEEAPLADIDFGLTETGRWLLKVIGGPNNGAEFSLHAGRSYLIGTDPKSCDIIFHDTSVSRQHARINVEEDESIVIEDLKSRNGTFLDGERIEGKQPFAPNVLVTMGTTSFILYDRQGDMQTIISPLMPSIVKVLQKEEEPVAEPEPPPPPPPPQEIVEEPVVEEPPAQPEKAPVSSGTVGAFILIGILTGLFVVVGIGMATLFQTQPAVVEKPTVNPEEHLQEALAAFPSIKYSFNNVTGRLLLVGHVLTATDKNQLIYNLQGLNFIKFIDDTGIIIDEFVWTEMNQVLSKHPEWRGITVHSPTAGKFVISGYLKSRREYDTLSDYITSNFSYPDLLERRVIVEEDIVSSINSSLHNMGVRTVNVEMANGEITLKGNAPQDKKEAVTALVQKLQSMPGVRAVNNFVTEVAPEESMINISDKYTVTGFSKQGDRINVVVSGRILTQGDVLDGMTITKITPNAVFLKKDNVQYRIDFNR